ncbi:MAG: hypothetical protein P9X24_17135 [Candidatus Hatepunaea meridiana]|nr:hypothetical protein [Candidatus Hatepunaea meridiana]
MQKNEIISTTHPFPSVIGQTETKDRVSRILTSDKLAHAYLFVGPEGCGRLAMALEIARTLNCAKTTIAESQFGCECNSCRKILKWQHPNLYPVFPLPKLDKDKGVPAQEALREIIAIKAKDVYAPYKLTGTGMILIDQIRDLFNKLSFSMDRPGVRTIIVQPAERLRDESANAFLKLLEEPPDKCCFLLVSESIRDLLPTIISRCQMIKFPPLAKEDIRVELTQKYGVDPTTAETSARLSNGSFSRSLAMAQGDTYTKINASLEFLRAAVVGNAENITAYIDSFSKYETRSEIKGRISHTAFWIKDALARKAFDKDTVEEHLSIADNETVIEKMASLYSNTQLCNVWQALEEARLAIDSNGIIPLILTALALKIQRILK